MYMQLIPDFHERYLKFLSFTILLLWFYSSHAGQQSVNHSKRQASLNAPTVWVESVNDSVIGRYEKFEIHAGLNNATYSNPYNPDEIDLRAIFTAPSGRTWEIYGFYDDYQNIDQWKVRFAPNEEGEWSYALTAADANGSGISAEYSFTVVASDHHGWIHIAQKNPHYLMYDNGASFFGVGMCYPWNVTLSGITNLAANGANMFFYWNGTYDGQGNGGGYRLVESIESGLGKYDQSKSARVDQIIEWAEQTGVSMVFVLWPHDYLADKISSGWPRGWSKNPYKSLCSAAEFYGHQQAWEFQQKQYRYIIARWGYSRGLAGWQIVCEISGTDGWELGDHAVAEQWSGKVHQFFKNNDPFQHPTTGSQHGYVTCNWKNGYEIFDLPNREIYESQGWYVNFSNVLRSSVHNYANAIRDLWDGYKKPAIIGETGYSLTYVNTGTLEYTKLYHNVLWATFSNGIAATPFWWGYGNSQITSAEVLQQMKAFSVFVKNIDFANHSFVPANATANDCDVYGMKNDSLAFGWIRHIDDLDISGKACTFQGMSDGTYQISWFDTWTGQEIGSDFAGSVNGQILDVIPILLSGAADIAFIITPAEAGAEPAKLDLIASKESLFSNAKDTLTITSIIKDLHDRFCLHATNEIHFHVKGPVHFIEDSVVNAQNGMASIQLLSEGTPGSAIIIASSAGLISDTLEIDVKNYLIIDDFEQYTSSGHFESNWSIYSGTHTAIALDQTAMHSGNYGLRLDYTVGVPFYAGAFRTLTMDWSQFSRLRWWIKPDGSGRLLTLMFKESGGRIWSYDYTLSGTQETVLDIPFAEFSLYFGAGEMDLGSITQIILYLTKGSVDAGSGVLYFDDFEVSISSATQVEFNEKPICPQRYMLFQNYPNPFNSSTSIRYQLSKQSQVQLTVFNLLGEEITALVNDNQDIGIHIVRFDASELPTGVYFYRLKVEQFQQTKKMVFIR